MYDRNLSKLLTYQELLDYLNFRPTKYLDEVAYFIWDTWNIVTSESLIKRILKRRKWSYKKVRPGNSIALILKMRTCNIS